MGIPFDNTYVRLPDRFFAKQSPATVPEPKLIRVNRELAAELGIDPKWLESDDGVAVLSGNAVAEGSEPIAQAYAGHQFGGFSPQLGDGRAILLGEVLGADGVRRDVQLKGSGRTAFSRGGDGKSALGPVLREFIVSEAMSAFGVPTTRALAAVTTGEEVFRQEGAVPGGVFTRVASSHIRVGTFQYFLAQNDIEALRELAEFTIKRHFPEAEEVENRYLGLLEGVVAAQAKLIPHWMSLGFIHGVMNTDNCAVSGETIDYGPCAFMEGFHPDCVFSSIDRGARYSWSNQPEMAMWNLTRFAETLLPLIADDPDVAMKKAETVLGVYPSLFGEEYRKRFGAKVGIVGDASPPVVQSCLELLAAQNVDFTLFFRHLTRVAAGEDGAELRSLFAKPEALDAWLVDWRKAAGGELQLDAMRASNPILIPRNHRVEQAIQAGNRGDFAIFNRLVDALAKPFEDRAEFSDLEARPQPDEVVHETFCGT